MVRDLWRHSSSSGKLKHFAQSTKISAIWLVETIKVIESAEKPTWMRGGTFQKMLGFSSQTNTFSVSFLKCRPSHCVFFKSKVKLFCSSSPCRFHRLSEVEFKQISRWRACPQADGKLSVTGRLCLPGCFSNSSLVSDATVHTERQHQTQTNTIGKTQRQCDSNYFIQVSAPTFCSLCYSDAVALPQNWEGNPNP